MSTSIKYKIHPTESQSKNIFKVYCSTVDFYNRSLDHQKEYDRTTPTERIYIARRFLYTLLNAKSSESSKIYVADIGAILGAQKELESNLREDNNNEHANQNAELSYKGKKRPYFCYETLPKRDKYFKVEDGKIKIPGVGKVKIDFPFDIENICSMRVEKSTRGNYSVALETTARKS